MRCKSAFWRGELCEPGLSRTGEPGIAELRPPAEGLAERAPPSAESLIVRIPIARFQHSDSLFLKRKPNRQRQPFALGAFDCELAAVFAHDPSHDE
jgi:hypothetical protein